MERGEIYYIDIPNPIGAEMCKSRPGIIVSNEETNMRGIPVQVVYLSQSIQRDTPAHVTVRSSGAPSQAICEQVATVDRSRVGTFIGCLTSEELERVDIALAYALGLTFEKRPTAPAQEPVQEPAPRTTEPETELAVYKHLYNGVLELLARRGS